MADICWITNDMQVNEEFIGLYNIPLVHSRTLVSMIKDVLTRMNLSVNKLRGQSYDGESAMKGTKNGVAKQMCDMEPRAVHIHCYGHSLNVAANGTLKISKLMNECFGNDTKSPN